MAKTRPFTVVWLGLFIRCTSCPDIGQAAAVQAVAPVQLMHAVARVTEGTYAYASAHWSALDLPAARLAERMGSGMGEMYAVESNVPLQQCTSTALCKNLHDVLSDFLPAWIRLKGVFSAVGKAVRPSTASVQHQQQLENQRLLDNVAVHSGPDAIASRERLDRPPFEARFVVNCPDKAIRAMATKLGTCGNRMLSDDSRATSHEDLLQLWWEAVLFPKFAQQQWAGDCAGWISDLQNEKRWHTEPAEIGVSSKLTVCSEFTEEFASWTGSWTKSNSSCTALAFDVLPIERGRRHLQPAEVERRMTAVDVRVYVLGYDEYSVHFAQESFAAAPWAVVTELATNKYLESNMYFDGLLNRYHEWKALHFVGTLSWRARTKRPIPDRLDADLRGLEHADVVPFMYHGRGNISLVQFRHEHLPELWVYLLTKLGYTEEEAMSPDIPFFYSNYWVARPSVMLQYIQFARRAREVLENVRDPRILSMLYSNPNYEDPPEHFRAATGLPRYTYHPFLMERLICFFCYINKLRVVPVFWFE